MKYGFFKPAMTATSNDWKFAKPHVPMIGSLRTAVFAAALTMSAFAQTASDVAAEAGAKKLQQAGFEQKLGAQIPLGTKFTDDAGRPVTLAKYFDGKKPVLLTLNYFRCPMLCTLILNGVVDCATNLPFKVGREFDIVTVSFDPRDTAQLAAAKKAIYVEALGQPEAAAGWHFLTGTKDQIDALCGAVGFSYVFDAKSGQFGHASGIMIATQQGKLSHYFYGIDYATKDVRLGLVEASQGKIGSPVEKFMLWCYHYDSVSGKYSASVKNILKISCSATALILFGFLIYAFRRELGFFIRMKAAEKI